MKRQADCDALIFGQGLAGSILYHALWERGLTSLVISEPSLSSCSRVAAGLINPISGQRLNLAWQAERLIPFACQYYAALEKRLNCSLYHPRPAVRLLDNAESLAAWTEKGQLHEYAEWIAPLKSTNLPASLKLNSCNGFTTQCTGFLDTVKLVDATRDELLANANIIEGQFCYDDLSFNESSFSYRGHRSKYAIFCEGHLGSNNPWFANIPYKKAKGVIGEIGVDADFGETIILASKFLIPIAPNRLRVGSTYRWDDESEQPDIEGIQEIEDFLNNALDCKWKWIEQRAGIRPATAGALPVVGPSSDNPSMISFNGFGSKGAMQIPYFAARLANHIAKGEALPQRTLPERFNKKRAAEPRRWRAVDIAREAVLEILRPGEMAIDATAGNGHDTEWLTTAVGDNGHVFAFDVQQEAIKQTRQRLEKFKLLHRVTLFERNHAEMHAALPPEASGKIKAVVFNLGYLPLSDKSIITKPSSTIEALNQALQLLAPGGRISVVIYPAHPGGELEAEAVQEWKENLSNKFTPRLITHPAGKKDAPQVLIVDSKEVKSHAKTRRPKAIWER